MKIHADQRRAGSGTRNHEQDRQMTKCENCAHYKPETDWHGWCAIELPVWLHFTVINLTDNRVVYAENGCDLGEEEAE